MLGREWWRGAVIYQVYLASFSDSNGDGIGDLVGLADRLGHIGDLGVDAIWISPFYRSPLEDGGYDVADYRAVDRRFGTEKDFDRILARAHQLDLRVIIDQVWSHTASAHPWFRESRRSRLSDKSDWYVWADPRDDGSPPNNWLSVFGGSAWQWEAGRRQYYLHHFLPSQPKLNLRQEAVMAAHFANAEFWLSRGVDGFRLDAIDFMLHDQALQDNPPRPVAGETPWNPFRMQRHLYDMCHPDAEALMTRIREFTDRFPGVATIGEISSETGALERVAAATGGTKLHMAYTLGVMKSAFSASMIRQALAEAVDLNKQGWLCWSFGNHDVARVASRWNPTGREAAVFARLQMALLLSLPGSACLFQGEELGLLEAKLAQEKARDPFGRAFYSVFAGRDGARTPLPWIAGAPQSGFSTAAETWLPIAPEHDALAIAQQACDPGSLFSCYRKMLAWRRQHPALQIGDVTLFDTSDPVIAFRRRLGSDSVIAVFNCAPEIATVSLQGLPRFRPAEELGFVVSPGGDALILPPYGVSLGLG